MLRPTAGAPLAALLLAACTTTSTPPPAATPGGPTGAALPSAAALSAVAEAHRAPEIRQRRFTPEELWQALAPVVGASGVRVEEAGRSLHGRPIRALTLGGGATRVLLWSQMHGDEPTATMALADVLRFLATAQGDPLRERIVGALTVTAVPMLNPDGAVLFQRENAVGVDVNRDARALATPEARALKALRDRLRPDFGFNLHDQGARTLAGPGGRQVAIALLAPPAEASGAYGPVRARARQVAATLATTLADHFGAELAGRVAKYDDSFNPRAFGDLMQQWGTSTVLIESGALPGDPEKQRLRTVNVHLLLTALDAIASGAYAAADPQRYEGLPVNARIATDLLVRGGSVVLAGAPLRVDLALAYDDAVARKGLRVRDVGDLRGTVALDTLDATGLFLHPAPASLTTRDGRSWLRLGAPAALVVRRSAADTGAVVRTIGDAAEAPARE